jgi:hypothetical protein
MPIRLMGYVAAAALFACTPLGLPARTGSCSVARVPAPAGDSPSDAGPLATNLSSRLTRRDLARAMKLVGDWQLRRLPADAQYEWTFAALYAGMMAVPAEVAGDAYKQAMRRIGEQLGWQPGPRVLHADDQAVGQMYLEQYMLHKDPAMLAPIKSRMDEEMNPGRLRKRARGSALTNSPPSPNTGKRHSPSASAPASGTPVRTAPASTPGCSSTSRATSRHSND